MFANVMRFCVPSDNAGHSVFSYPAGESQVRINPAYIDATLKADLIIITASIRSAEHVMELVLLHGAIINTRPNACYIKLVLPYLPYSRADRAFVPGDCIGLESFGLLIGSMGLDEVVTLDVHNLDKAKLYIPYLVNKKPDQFIHKTIAELADKKYGLNVLFPDDGAAKRYDLIPHVSPIDHHRKYPGYAIIGEEPGAIEIRLLQCHKRREAGTGKLLGFDVPQGIPDGPILIVDDLCDGGGTFLGIAKTVHEREPRRKMYLYVTHGVFSQGMRALILAFERIYTTNTFSQNIVTMSRGSAVCVYDALPLLFSEESEW